jgi:hypothetical protein
MVRLELADKIKIVLLVYTDNKSLDRHQATHPV